MARAVKEVKIFLLTYTSPCPLIVSLCFTRTHTHTSLPVPLDVCWRSGPLKLVGKDEVSNPRKNLRRHVCDPRTQSVNWKVTGKLGEGRRPPIRLQNQTYYSFHNQDFTSLSLSVLLLQSTTSSPTLYRTPLPFRSRLGETGRRLSYPSLLGTCREVWMAGLPWTRIVRRAVRT